MSLTDPVRFHNLRMYGRSGLHGYASRTAEFKQTAPMLLGSAVDAMLFGHKRVVVYPGSVRRGKEWEKFAAENANDIIVSTTEADKAARMVAAVRACELALPLLQGAYQQTILFRWMGLDCRATPDVIGDGFLTELKTSMSSDPVRFPWHALRMAYPAQMRMQNIANQERARDHYIVCVESSDPYPVTVFRLSEQSLEQGEKQLIAWAERLKQCEAAQVWRPYVDCIVPIDIPEQEGDELIFADDE